jgi:hypothetical protein
MCALVRPAAVGRLARVARDSCLCAVNQTMEYSSPNRPREVLVGIDQRTRLWIVPSGGDKSLHAECLGTEPMKSREKIATLKEGYVISADRSEVREKAIEETGRCFKDYPLDLIQGAKGIGRRSAEESPGPLGVYRLEVVGEALARRRLRHVLESGHISREAIGASG